MPTVVLEAMARAMPAIVSDVGATRELTDEGSGILIDKNDLDELIEAMTRILDMPETEYEQMSYHALHNFMEHYTWSAVARQHLEVFRDLAGTA